MFTKTARYYDLIYGFKEYANEARQIADLILRERPDARRILDVACGTAEHAKYLAETFQVDGIDLEPEFIDIARRKIPAGDFRFADMSAFELGVRYDVLLCLFSSIGYLTRPEQVVSALVCFKNHLGPGGVIAVEPWFTPEDWHVGALHMTTVDRPDLKICRLSVSEAEGRLSRIRFHYLIGTSAGVEHLTEDHALALYTREEMLGFFEDAGLAVQYEAGGISGRGLYIAR